MTGLTPVVPAVYGGGRWWSSVDIEARAASWAAFADRTIGGEAACAVALPATADGVALFVAGGARSGPAVLLSSDPASWPSASVLAPLLPLLLPPSLGALAPLASALGYTPVALTSDHTHGRSPALTPFRTPGFVVFTSGSTAAPKPVFRPSARVLAGARARADALGLQAGEGVVCGVPLSTGHGLVQLATAMLLGGAFGMVGPVNHREVLAVIGRPEFGCWRATAHFADVLGRCALTGPAAVPRICLLSSPVSRKVFDRFLDRFGVPLRQSYSSTETAAVAVDAGPPSSVVFGTVGRPLPGVEVRVGLDPASPVEEGGTARLWVRSPWQMAGYGMPPDVGRPGLVDGWWPTRDLGTMDASGRLTLCGRLDDCVRTRDGRIVNLEAVAAALRGIDGVQAVAVLPLQGDAGTSFGAVIQCGPDTALEAVRGRIGSDVPAWARPRAIVSVPAIPRLLSGKADRRACQRILADRQADV